MTTWAAVLLLAGGACAENLPPSAARASPPTEAPAGIRLKGPEKFQAGAREALERIRRTTTGGALLKELEAAGRRITIRLARQETHAGVLYPTGDGDSMVLWDPDYQIEGFPSFIILYHELVHALHEAGPGRLPGKDEEWKTIGLKQFAGYRLSENNMRREVGLPLRADLTGRNFLSEDRKAAPGR